MQTEAQAVIGIKLDQANLSWFNYGQRLLHGGEPIPSSPTSQLFAEEGPYSRQEMAEELDAVPL